MSAGMSPGAVKRALALAALSAVVAVSAPDRVLAAEPFDLVIRGGRVIDPESQLDAVRHIGVRDGRVAAVSEEPLRGRRTLDASGLVVAPGFIDLHAHGQQLPAARMQAFDGVTTALELEGGVLQVARFHEDVAREGRPIHYGVSASWADARVAAFGPRAVDGDLPNTLATAGELESLLGHLGQAIDEGAIGIGIPVGYAPESGNKEFHAVNALAAARGVPAFTHVRYGSVIEPKSSFSAYQEVVAVAAATGVQIHICHLNSTSGRDIDAAIDLISGAQRRGLPISVEAYPYSAASTSIGAAFFKGPQWQERLGGVRYEDFEVTGQPLDEKRFLELQANAPDTMIVFNYLRPERDPLDQARLDRSVLYPGGAIASDAVWWELDGKRVEGDVWPLPKGAFAHPRSAGTFSRLLRVYVRERGVLTLAQAIEKASLIPARILERSVPQMRDKGRIKTGADADLIVFDPAVVSDRATFTAPAQTSVGMKHVIVSGTPVIANGKLLRDARPGKPIRRAVAAVRS